MPYKELPFSHQFLTGMTAVCNPQVVGPQWDCVPYTQEKIEKIMAHEQFKKDYNRVNWNFGPRLMVSEVEADEEAKQEDKAFFVKAEHEARLVEELQREAGDLNLSTEESAALWAFAMSVGDGTVIQAGAIRGVSELCFDTCWLTQIYQLLTKGENQKETRYDEGQRVERLADGRLKVSSLIEVDQVLDLADSLNPITVTDADTKHLIQFYNEQHIERKQDKSGQVSFTMVPHSQKLLLENTFWENRILPFAKKYLSEVQVFLPKDFFTLIPCLADPEFRREFCEKLAQRPQHEYDFAKKWIEVCYKDHPAELQPILAFLNQEREKAQVAEQIQAIQLEPVAMLLAQMPYLDNPSFAKAFSKKVAAYSLGQYNHFIRQLERQEPDRVKQALSTIPTATRLINGTKNLINAHPKRAVALALGLVLGAVGAALTATGVFAPLGLALGWAGLALASPTAAVAVAAVCFAAPMVLGKLAIEMAKGFMALVRSCCFPRSQPSGSGRVAAISPVPVTVNADTRAITAGVTHAAAEQRGVINLAQQLSSAGQVNNNETRTALSVPSQAVVQVADNLGSALRSASKVLDATNPLSPVSMKAPQADLEQPHDLVATLRSDRSHSL